MAGEGRPPTTLLVATAKVVGGRAKPGHDTWVTLSAGWYYATKKGRSLVRAGAATAVRSEDVRARLLAAGTDAPIHVIDDALWLLLSARICSAAAQT